MSPALPKFDLEDWGERPPLAALQQRCEFEPGHVRCSFLESQPAGTPTMHWRLADAGARPLAEGHVDVADLLELQPWGGY